MALMRQASPDLPKPKPKTEWDRKWRGDYKLPGGVGLIEYEFGGAAEAKWYEWTHGLSATGEPYQPTCLDEIFAGGAVKMHNSKAEVFFLKPGLQRLFGMHRNRLQGLLGMHRNRFPQNLHESYDFRAVTKIMKALLKKPEGKAPARGGAPRQQWPSKSDLKTRVLSGIEARINSLSVSEQIKPHIKAEFLAVVHRHLPDSAKK